MCEPEAAPRSGLQGLSPPDYPITSKGPPENHPFPVTTAHVAPIHHQAPAASPARVWALNPHRAETLEPLTKISGKSNKMGRLILTYVLYYV